MVTGQFLSTLKTLVIYHVTVWHLTNRSAKRFHATSYTCCASAVQAASFETRSQDKRWVVRPFFPGATRPHSEQRWVCRTRVRTQPRRNLGALITGQSSRYVFGYTRMYFNKETVVADASTQAALV